MSEQCGSCSQAGGCSGTPGGEGCAPGPDPVQEKTDRAVSRIKEIVVVISGKGGVGKSTVAVNLALALAHEGRKVGLMDVDVHGPSVPRLLSMRGKSPHMDHGPDGGYMEPVVHSRNLSVMSVGFLLPDENQSVIWRGPVKMGVIRQFLTDVTWGDLDVLVVDCPPGTGDEPLSALQILGEKARAVIVTTPQQVAVDDARRSIHFVREVGNEIIGLVENMSGFVCMDCGKVQTDLYTSGGGEKLARDAKIPFLGRIPLDPELMRAADEGYDIQRTHPESAAAKAFMAIAAPVSERLGPLPEETA